MTNGGTGAAITAQVKDQLPAGLTFVSATGTGWTCSNASGLITCAYSGSIAASGTSAISVVVSANAGTGGQSLTNYASIDPTGGASAPTPGSSCSPISSCASNTSTVAAGVSLSLTKSAPSPGLTVGAQSTYTLTVTNGGTGAATSAQVKDQLPAGLTFVSATGTGWTCANASGLITCNYSGSLAASGTSAISVVVSTNAGTGGQSLANYASIDPTGGASAPTPGASCSPSGSCASNTSTVTTTPKLAITISSPSPGLTVSAISTYTVTVTNNGSATSARAQASIQLPIGLIFVAAGSTGWTCSNAAGLVTCNYTGPGMAVAAASSFPLQVRTAGGTGGQILPVYASVDPTGGLNPALPGPTCTGVTHCASVSAAVIDTKSRTEAQIRDFMAARGHKIVEATLDLTRLTDRLSLECATPDAAASRPQGVRALSPPTPTRGGSSSASQSANLAERDRSPILPPWSPNPFGALPQTRDPREDAAARNESSRTPFGSLSSADAGSANSGALGSTLTGQLNSAAGAFKVAGSYGALERRQAFASKDAYCQNKLDAWFSAGADWTRGPSTSALFGISQFGVDYRVSDGALIGMMVQVDQMSFNGGASGYRAQGWGMMAGPYFAIKLGGGVMFDMRALAGASRNTISSYSTYADAFSTRRWLIAGRLSGRWNIGSVYLMPSVEYVHYADQSRSYVDAFGATIDSQKVSVGQVVFGPTLGYQGRIMDDRVTMMSFIEAKGRYNLAPMPASSASLETSVVHQSPLQGSIGLGLALRHDSGKSVSLRTNYSGFSSDGVKSLSVAGQVHIAFQ